MKSLKFLKILKKVFDSENLLLMDFNVFIFIVVEIIFFWYILSETLVYIVLDKSDLIIYMANQDPIIKKNLINYLNTIDVQETIPQRALIEKEARISYNYNLILTYLGPTVYTIASILVSIIFYKIIGLKLINRVFSRYNYNYQLDNKPISKSSYHLLLCVIFSFIPEILFYYIVIRTWKFISDAQLILLLYPVNN